MPLKNLTEKENFAIMIIVKLVGNIKGKSKYQFPKTSNPGDQNLSVWKIETAVTQLTYINDESLSLISPEVWGN